MAHASGEQKTIDLRALGWRPPAEPVGKCPMSVQLGRVCGRPTEAGHRLCRSHLAMYPELDRVEEHAEAAAS